MDATSAGNVDALGARILIAVRGGTLAGAATRMAKVIGLGPASASLHSGGSC